MMMPYMMMMKGGFLPNLVESSLFEYMVKYVASTFVKMIFLQINSKYNNKHFVDNTKINGDFHPQDIVHIYI